MNLFQGKYKKFVFALCVLFGLAAQVSNMHAECEYTQELEAILKAEVVTADAEVAKKYTELLDILEKMAVIEREFVQELSNNKKISYYTKELDKLVKELGEKTKPTQGVTHKGLVSINARLYKLHKYFHEFLSIIKANEHNAPAISMKLMQRQELKNLIPDRAGWTITNVLAALNARCKK